MSILRFNKAGALAPAAGGAEVEITLTEWRAGVRPEGAGFALVLPNDADVAEIGVDARRFDAVVLDFPSFKDGRALSQAALLRARYGFSGEIRARGDVRRDQARFMARSGFTAFEAPAAAAKGFAEALAAYSVVYQSGVDGEAPAFARRAECARAA
jgi:uncharacterized protein (DUF934 family)